MRHAIQDRAEFASCQVMHMEEAFKFDLLIADRTPIDAEAQARALPFDIGAGAPILTACPEHIFVLKLRCYDATRRQSERQWRDLFEIARVSRDMDRALIARWSAEFDLASLAAEILAEADAREEEVREPPPLATEPSRTSGGGGT